MASPVKPPISIGIQPQIAFYSVILGGACALAAYTEKYRRNQDEIDGRLKEQYFANMQEQRAKTPQIAQAVRGQDMRLDDAMNKWVWGGKAAIGTTSTGGGGNGGGGKSNATLAAGATTSSDAEDTSSSSDDEEWDSSSSSSSSDEEPAEDALLSKKERRKRRKERKRKRTERRLKRLEEKKKLEAERQKLVMQSVAAGAVVGAVAVAASMFLSSRK